jgi:hypothetical protein
MSIENDVLSYRIPREIADDMKTLLDLNKKLKQLKVGQHQ